MGQIIALDSMVFIYLFESDSRYIHKIRDIFNEIESGKLNAITSTISVIESLSPAKYSSNNHILTEISRFFSESPFLSVKPVDLNIGSETAALRRQYPLLRTPDAIQLATATIHHANTFITNDLKLLHLDIPNLEIKALI